MSKSGEPDLSNCGCCEGGAQGQGAGQEARYHQAGMPAFAYRIGTQPQLLERMKARLHLYRIPDGDYADARPLAQLRTRSPDDPAIALLDAWATVGDVLSFYQERIANEGFLRTAVERRSVLELARSIGYELNPGVSAETFLAFLVDDAEGAPTEAIVAAGTQVQSIPSAQDELPQTFETTGDLVAKLGWNSMRPRLLHPQSLSSGMTHVYLDGSATGLQKGDMLLLEIGSVGYPRRVLNVAVDHQAQLSRVEFEATLTSPDVSLTLGSEAVLDIAAEPLQLTLENVKSQVFDKTWHEADLQAFFTLHEWDAAQVQAYVAQLLANTFSGADDRCIALRERASVFGHNAVDWQGLAKSAKAAYLNVDEACSITRSEWPRFSVFSPKTTFTVTKEAGKVSQVMKMSGMVSEAMSGTVDSIAASRNTLDCSERSFPDSSSTTIDLDRVYEKINPQDWVVLKSSGLEQAYTVTGLSESGRAEYGLSARTSRLTLSGSGLGSFSSRVRSTTVFVHNETLALAPLPVQDDIMEGSDSLWLQGMVLGLVTGQRLVISGQDAAVEGLQRSEIVVLESIRHQAGLTLLGFEDALGHGYRRDSVTLNGNLVAANHGETVHGEVLGSGDGASTHQHFRLRKPPLTHTSAASASGSEAALSVRVDGIEWQQASSLYELNGRDKAYIVRLDDDGNVNVLFGDGKRGARLTTGAENVTADYRSGIGLAGEVDAGSLSLLKKRPYGIRSVSNPFAASGAADPEILDDARANAPLTVLTLDRIVSVQDHQDFARAFAGIGKARADVVWDGEAERLVLTVADSNGDEVRDALYDNLRDAIEGARDPLREVVLRSYQPLVFQLTASVLIDPAHRWEDIERAAKEALLAAFDFNVRAFAQPVSAAEVVEVIHAIDGVIAVDLDHLYLTPPDSGSLTPMLNTLLAAQPARFDSAQGLQPAQLLMIHPFGVELTEMSHDGSTV